MWCSNRRRCSFLLKMRSAGGDCTAYVSGVSTTSDADVRADSEGAAASADAGCFMVCVWRVPDCVGPVRGFLFPGSDNEPVRRRVAVRPLWRTIWTSVDGRLYAFDSNGHHRPGCSGNPGWL